MRSPLGLSGKAAPSAWVGAFHGSGTLGLTTRGSILLGYPPARFDPQAGEGLNRAERVARRHWGIAQRLAGTAIAGSSQPQAGRPAHCGGSTRPTRAECVARRHRTALSGRRVQPPRSRPCARVASASAGRGQPRAARACGQAPQATPSDRPARSSRQALTAGHPAECEVAGQEPAWHAGT